MNRVGGVIEGILCRVSLNVIKWVNNIVTYMVPCS